MMRMICRNFLADVQVIQETQTFPRDRKKFHRTLTSKNTRRDSFQILFHQSTALITTIRGDFFERRKHL